VFVYIPTQPVMAAAIQLAFTKNSFDLRGAALAVAARRLFELLEVAYQFVKAPFQRLIRSLAKASYINTTSAGIGMRHPATRSSISTALKLIHLPNIGQV
jgi:hypothetical protein